MHVFNTYVLFSLHGIIKCHMPFRWQINASSVGKLVGAFKLRNDPESKREVYKLEALAKTWANNLKRMPRFGVQPSTTIESELSKRNQHRTTEQSVETVLDSSPEMKTFVHKAVSGSMAQTVAVKAIEESAKSDAKRAMIEATKAAEDTARAAEDVMRHSVKANKLRVMRKFATIKSGVKKTRAKGWFFVERNDEQHVYHMSPTGRSARKSTVEQASNDNWVLPQTMKKAKEKVISATAKREKLLRVKQLKDEMAQEKVKVAANIRRVATTTIQTTKGIRAEDEDLKKVQKKKPTVRQGNKKAYFYSVFDRPYGAFVIGYIDGFDTSTGAVVELKHRARGLFYELREYERVQCFVYMKMLKVKRAKLIETYQGEQREYVIEWDDTIWRNIENGLVQVVRDLNKAEKDSEFRSKLVELLI